MPTATIEQITLQKLVDEFDNPEDSLLEGPRTIDFIPSKPEILEIEIKQAMKAGLLPKPPATVLDLGSGNGIAAALFALKGFDAYGIELNPGLVTRSQEHASRVGLKLTIAMGNYFPRDVREKLKEDYHVRLRDSADPYKALGREFKDFDLIFNYPFPTQMPAIFQLFGDYARKGQRLMLFGNENCWKPPTDQSIARIGPEKDAKWHTVYEKQ